MDQGDRLIDRFELELDIGRDHMVNIQETAERPLVDFPLIADFHALLIHQAHQGDRVARVSE